MHNIKLSGLLRTLHFFIDIAKTVPPFLHLKAKNV